METASSIISVTLSAKTSLMLGVHKAGFRREGHNSMQTFSLSLQAKKIGVFPSMFQGLCQVILECAK